MTTAAQKRAYYERNKAKVKARAAQWKQDNREKVRAQAREYARTSPVVQAYQEARRQTQEYKRYRVDYQRKRRETMGHTKYEGYDAILRRDPCAYCGGPAEQIDHIVPVSNGGSNTWDNLTASCARCNQRKYSASLLDWMLRA